MKDIVERLRKGKSAGGYWREKEAADEIERLREALQMWVKFWENDQSIDVTNDQWLAEEAMEATRQILRDDNV